MKHKFILNDAIETMRTLKGINFEHIDAIYEEDLYCIKDSDMRKLERMFTEDELTCLLTAYVMLKSAKGKKAKLSKFVKKMVA